MSKVLLVKSNIYVLVRCYSSALMNRKFSGLPSSLILFVLLYDLYRYFCKQCYTEVKPGMYGDMGEVMEGCNQWYVFRYLHLTSYWMNWTNACPNKIKYCISCILITTKEKREAKSDIFFWITPRKWIRISCLIFFPVYHRGLPVVAKRTYAWKTFRISFYSRISFVSNSASSALLQDYIFLLCRCR